MLKGNSEHRERAEGEWREVEKEQLWYWFFSVNLCVCDQILDIGDIQDSWIILDSSILLCPSWF